ncbi:MAG: molybdenum cofactor biosynthesis protein MoaE [Chloroflexi bacterium]|nr:molybdenum cofactor biosynthesis protein MoaE [Chloroflexota bacterium]
MILVTREPLDPEVVTATVRRESNGAVVTFLGTTRNETGGHRVLYLEYEAYEGMAGKMLTRIAGEVSERWGIADVAIAHRFGRLQPGEVSMVVAVASSHRAAAFEACQYVVDRVKQNVPIWKKEVFQDGAAWVGIEGQEYSARVSD